MSDYLFAKERKLPIDLKKRINNYIYPSKEQIEDWRINHFLDGYWKCLDDIKDIIIEIKITSTGEKMQFFSLFSWCDGIRYFPLDDEYETIEDFYDDLP